MSDHQSTFTPSQAISSMMSADEKYLDKDDSGRIVFAMYRRHDVLGVFAHLDDSSTTWHHVAYGARWMTQLIHDFDVLHTIHQTGLFAPEHIVMIARMLSEKHERMVTEFRRQIITTDTR